jgi:hypothetical protein
MTLDGGWWFTKWGMVIWCALVNPMLGNLMIIGCWKKRNRYEYALETPLEKTEKEQKNVNQPTLGQGESRSGTGT